MSCPDPLKAKNPRQRKQRGHGSDFKTRCVEAGLDNLQQKQDQNDGQDQAQAATTVVPKAGSHAKTAKPEQKNQNNKKDEHLVFLLIKQCNEYSA
jgi:hypothetical protein